MVILHENQAQGDGRIVSLKIKGTEMNTCPTEFIRYKYYYIKNRMIGWICEYGGDSLK